MGHHGAVAHGKQCLIPNHAQISAHFDKPVFLRQSRLRDPFMRKCPCRSNTQGGRNGRLPLQHHFTSANFAHTRIGQHTHAQPRHCAQYLLADTVADA